MLSRAVLACYRRHAVRCISAHTVLGVSAAASASEIKAAWKRQAKAAHPDLNPGDPSAAERFAELQNAYEQLGRARSPAAGSMRARTSAHARRDDDVWRRQRHP